MMNSPNDDFWPFFRNAEFSEEFAVKFLRIARTRPESAIIFKSSVITVIAAIMVFIVCLILLSGTYQAYQNSKEIHDVFYEENMALNNLGKTVGFFITTNDSRNFSQHDIESIFRDLKIDYEKFLEVHARFVSLPDSLGVFEYLSEYTSPWQDIRREKAAIVDEIGIIIESVRKFIELGDGEFQRSFHGDALTIYFLFVSSKLQEYTQEIIYYHKNFFRTIFHMNIVFIGLSLLIILITIYYVMRPIRTKILKYHEIAFNESILLAQKAMIDGLTKLGNRDCLLAILAHTFNNNGPNRVGWAVLADLDYFKPINDNFGHRAGDEALRVTSRRLSEFAEIGGIAFRIGGDEFMIVFPESVTRKQLDETIASILKQFEEPIHWSDSFFEVNLSMGVVRVTSEYDSFDTVFAAADRALRDAKRHTGLRWQHFSETSDLTAIGIDQEERQLTRLLDSGHLRAYYQPIVNLRTGQIVMFESLVRITTGRGDPLLPERWLEEAMRLGFSARITWEMLNQVQKDHLRLENLLGRKIDITINIEESMFFDSRLHERIGLINADPNNNWLILEVPENVALDRSASGVALRLAELRRTNTRIFLDDFGAGLAYLSHLKGNQFDAIKIDKSMVDKISESNENIAIVRHLISMARELEMDTICEGIERSRDLNCLLNMGCDFGQGFYFGEAMDIEYWSSAFSNYPQDLSVARR
ncbi:MAG: bifunctional diguanylate cyclase/phosphodiesterase [Geminicoccaceae bacterium]